VEQEEQVAGGFALTGFGISLIAVHLRQDLERSIG
jgi:hypothetical protein